MSQIEILPNYMVLSSNTCKDQLLQTNSGFSEIRTLSIDQNMANQTNQQTDLNNSPYEYAMSTLLTSLQSLQQQRSLNTPITPCTPCTPLPANNDDATENDTNTMFSYQSQLRTNTKANLEKTTLVVMDWDDTLFPTTTINEILKQRDSHDICLLRDDEIAILHNLGARTYQLIECLINKYGSTNLFIVTNSLDGWILESLRYASCISTVYGDLCQLLTENQIPLFSAQSKFGKIANSNPTIWKTLCFDEIIESKINTNGPVSENKIRVISIGDQWTDHYAVKDSMEEHKMNIDKSSLQHVIKLKMHPNVQEMLDEMIFIQNCFDDETFSMNVSSGNNAAEEPVIMDYKKEQMKRTRRQIGFVCNPPISPLSMSFNNLCANGATNYSVLNHLPSL